MATVHEIASFLEQFAPPRLAESWDNVGLLVGNRQAAVVRVMTCLTITPSSAREAIQRQANLIVTHHPLPFHPLTRLTDETTEGRLLLELIGAGIAIYSPHTAFDSAREGINQRLANGLQLLDTRPLVLAPEGDLGSGRWGRLPQPSSLTALVERVKKFLRVSHLQCVGAKDAHIERVAVACGSAGEFLTAAVEAGCQCLVTGETRFHTCLASESQGIALILAGHYASERFAVEQLAEVLQRDFAGLEVWASRDERDPIQWM